MKVLEIRVESLEDSLNRFKEVFNQIVSNKNVKQEEYIAFSSVEEISKVLTPKRLQLLRFIKDNKPYSIREIAKQLNRDYKNVYTDLKLLKELGIIELKEKNGSLVPVVLYDEIDIKVPIAKAV